MYHGVILRNPITLSKMIYTSIQTTEQSKTKGLKLKLHLLQFDLFPVDYIFLRKFSDKTLKHSSHMKRFLIASTKCCWSENKFSESFKYTTSMTILFYIFIEPYLMYHSS